MYYCEVNLELVDTETLRGFANKLDFSAQNTQGGLREEGDAADLIPHRTGSDLRGPDLFCWLLIK